MKFISWNVNGFRACLGKGGFAEFFSQADADFFCIQETKMQPGQAEFAPEGYTQYWNSAVKRGYSGTAVFAKTPALSVRLGLGIERFDGEGRLITLEYPAFYLVCVYTPNAQRDLKRLSYRMEWEDAFCAYVKDLADKKGVVICGDMNVAHQEIDLKNAKSNRGNAGFTDEERAKMTALLSSGFVDTYRLLYPNVPDAYTWWSYQFQARARNVGWRIDYFLVSDRLKDAVREAKIHADILGSDHCPIELQLLSEQ